MTQKIRAGVVGTGYVSHHHIRAMKALPFVEVIGVCDRDEARAEQVAKKYGIPGVFPSLEAMGAAKPDAINVLTPPESHPKLAIEALEMGCHVFVEKPMADSVEECDAMIAAAKSAGRVLSVNHSARFDPVVLEAAEMVKNGACGEIVAVHFIRSSDYPTYAGGPLPAPYRQGSYPFRDLGVHGLYLLELFLGPTKDLQISYAATGRDPMLTFDEWRAAVKAQNGGTGYMYLSWNSRPMQNELVIEGTRGVIHVDCFLQTCELSGLLPGPKQIGMMIYGTKNALKKSARVPWNLVRFATGKLKPSPGIYRGVQDFYRALAASEAPPVSPEEGRNAIAWIASVSCGADREKEQLLEQQRSPQLAPAKILVTGSAGFLGSRLLEKLREAGENPRLLLRRVKPGQTCARIVQGSLGQPEIVDVAVRGVELVYHVGAAMKGGKEEFEQGTIWGTRNIIDACVKHGAKLVYVSSLSVLDHAGHRTGDPVTETSPLEPYPERRGAYTQTKLAAEQMVLDAVKNRGLKAVLLRPGQIFGPGAEKVTPNGVIGLAGKWLVAGMGGRKLPLVYRDDVADALILAANSPEAEGELINLVDTTPVDQNEYLRRCRPALGKTGVIRVPIFIFMILSSMIELLGAMLKRSVPLTRYRIRSLKPLYPFDVSKAQKILGWRPAVGTMEGLRKTFGK